MAYLCSMTTPLLQKLPCFEDRLGWDRDPSLSAISPALPSACRYCSYHGYIPKALLGSSLSYKYSPVSPWSQRGTAEPTAGGELTERRETSSSPLFTRIQCRYVDQRTFLLLHCLPCDPATSALISMHVSHRISSRSHREQPEAPASCSPPSHKLYRCLLCQIQPLKYA